MLAQDLQRLISTYVLAGHALADHLGVLIDEHEWARLIGVGEATSG